MDRQIVYISQVPQDTDVLLTNMHPYIAISKLAAGILGTNTQLNGLSCTPTSPASLSVLIGPGEIYQVAAIDTSGYGSLGTNSTQILKQGINLTSITTSTMAAPGTAGQSINYLIEFALNEIDGGSTILPYYNSANPAQPFSGPGNDNLPNYTLRQDTVGYLIKAGTAATTGTQTTPTPDSGYVGAWVVTIANGQSTITSGNISLYPGAPFISNTSSTYAVDTGAANAYVASLPITQYIPGQTFYIKATNTNTGASTININSLGTQNITYANGNALNAAEILAGQVMIITYDGTKFQLQNPAKFFSSQNETFKYAADSGAANAYVATLSPVITSYVAGLTLYIKAANANTGASTINVNSLGTKNITYPNANALNAGEILAGQVMILSYDGTQFQLQNPASFTSLQNSAFKYAADTGAANAYAIALSPAVTSYVTGLEVITKITNSNTGASTLNVNSLGTKNIFYNGSTITSGMLTSGNIAKLVYDGTQFQLLNPVGSTLNFKSIHYQIFSSSGTYTPSSGLSYCIVYAVGGGGGSGGTAATSTGQGAASASGGGGAYASSIFSAATIGSSQTITIGGAGSAGTAGNNSGGSGGNTTVGVLLTAAGGSGGSGGAAQSSFPVFITGGSGGLASSSTGTIVITGGDGGYSIVGGSTTSSLNYGLGGSTMLSPQAFGGGYGNGAHSLAAPASTVAVGGYAGNAGLVIILEFCTI